MRAFEPPLSPTEASARGSRPPWPRLQLRALPARPQLGALVARLEDVRGRALRAAEQPQLTAAWRQHGPLPADAAADRLRPHLARIGRHSALTELLPWLWGMLRVHRLLRTEPPAVHRRGARRGLFRSAPLEEAVARLRFVVQPHGPSPGSPGAGKSATPRALCDAREPARFAAALQRQVQEAVCRLEARGVTPVLLCDEAQFARAAVLDELRLGPTPPWAPAARSPWPWPATPAGRRSGPWMLRRRAGARCGSRPVATDSGAASAGCTPSACDKEGSGPGWSGVYRRCGGSDQDAGSVRLRYDHGGGVDGGGHGCPPQAEAGCTRRVEPIGGHGR